jgi:hypothetical protein
MDPGTRFARPDDNLSSSGPQEPHSFVPFEQIKQHAQRFAALGFQFGVAGKNEFGIVARGREQIGMHGKVGEFEFGQAALALAQQFAGAAQA